MKLYKDKLSILIALISIFLCSSFISDKFENELRLTNKKTIPRKYKNDTLTRYLIFRPPVKRYEKLKGSGICLIIREKGKLKTFPNWISNFKQLKAIDLIGNLNFQYVSELKKLRTLEELEYLAIESYEFNDLLVDELIELKSLKEIHVKKGYDKNDCLQVDRIKKVLKDCKVIVSQFADYADIYFSNKRKNNKP